MEAYTYLRPMSSISRYFEVHRQENATKIIIIQNDAE